MQSSAVVSTFALPHDTHDTFVRALGSNSLGNALFNSSEKRLLCVICAGVFTLPILASIVVVRATHSPLSLSAPTTQQAMLEQPSSVSPGSGDELAMASYFMDKAAHATQADAATFLSEAKALLEATTQQGANVDAVRTHLASLLGSPNADATTNPQRIAAPAPEQSAGALAGSTQSNATSTSVVMKAGTTSLVVSAPSITDTTQIYLTLSENNDNAVIYVKQKTAGSHFTLASLSPLMHDVTVTWYEIQSP